MVTSLDVKGMKVHVRSSSTRIRNTREIRPSESKERWVPRLCTLEGFGEDIHDRSGVDVRGLLPLTRLRVRTLNPNRKIFEARKRETAALGAGEKLVLGHPLAATIGDSARCMQNLEKVLFTGPKTSDTVTFICD